ncbi:acetoacetyl-synthase [Lepidopterella palustris CBS 459.81]|uniref:Acetoacetyl-synthase n=1 Tax=Lepidopterella palustris CBS 459.81 TaxID=1314670 RepID=A0A8E2EBU6_9PEZI|nr:acetoacetyl-synthase [Lepidopterella palustris CBS 459.81]
MSQQLPTQPPSLSPVWVPSNTSETNIEKFRSFVNKRRSLEINDYSELHAWSTNPATADHFWHDAFDFLELKPPGSPSPGVVRNVTDNANTLFPPPEFFPETTLNVAEILLRYEDPNAIAIHFAREGVSTIESVTRKNLWDRVERVADAMVSSGIQKGDRVAAIISNSVDAIVICLAALSLGALFSCTASDMGINGIVDRLAQITPKLIFADNGVVYAGKTHALSERIAEWSKILVGKNDNALQNVVVVPYVPVTTAMHKISRGTSWKEFLDRGTGRKLEFTQVPFAHPSFILYSSGTTGNPKCILHSGGGVALKVKIDNQLSNDIRKGDTFFQYTTTSWVMWVLNLVNLSTSATMLLYDGSPFYPDPSVLLRLSTQLNATHFGTSPRYLSELKHRNILPKKLGWNSLRVVTSTGASLASETYNWFYDRGFPSRVQLISMSGGTDIAGCFVGGTPTLPVHAGEIQAKSLGMAIDICDSIAEDAISVEASGRSGELVCILPFPSQPLGFWGDVGNERYRSSYFERYGSSVWCQGDFCERKLDTGGIIMLGRSDGVLNPSGIRFGSSEIYAIVDHIPNIQDSLCVGQQRPRDENETVILFVKMLPGRKLSNSLKRLIKNTIAERLSKRHVPGYIFQVPDIPYTVNGKKCEINVKQMICGRPGAVSATVANPEVIAYYSKFVEVEMVAAEEDAVEARL